MNLVVYPRVVWIEPEAQTPGNLDILVSEPQDRISSRSKFAVCREVDDGTLQIDVVVFVINNLSPRNAVPSFRDFCVTSCGELV